MSERDISGERDEWFTQSDYANRPTEDYQAKVFPDNHRSLLDRLNEEVPGEGGVQLLVDLERLRKSRPDTYRRLFMETSDPTTTVILSRLLRREGRTYDELTDATDKSRKSVRNRVYTLRDLNVVEVVGNPSAVFFVDDEIRLLVVDVLSFF